MTLKKSILESLVKNIVTQLVKEYSLLDKPASAMDGTNQNSSINDPNDTLSGAMSSSDQMKLKQMKDRQNRDLLKQKGAELSQKKTELDFNKKKSEQMKRFEIPNIQKSISQLKQN